MNLYDCMIYDGYLIEHMLGRLDTGSFDRRHALLLAMACILSESSCASIFALDGAIVG